MTTCRKRIKKAPFSKRFASTLIRLVGVFKFIRFRGSIYPDPEMCVLVWTEGVSGEKLMRFQILPGLVWTGPKSVKQIAN